MLCRRICIVWMIALASAAWTTNSQAAEFRGKVVSAAQGVLIIESKPDRKIAFMLAPEAHILRNGKVVQLEQLRIRDDVMVQTDPSGKVAVTVQARSWRGA